MKAVHATLPEVRHYCAYVTLAVQYRDMADIYPADRKRYRASMRSLARCAVQALRRIITSHAN